jgi:hypothetical protein
VSRGGRDYRAGKTYPARPGTVYLLCFSAPFGHARHYVGWTRYRDLRRVQAHLNGTSGVRLLDQARAAGITLELARTMRGTKRDEYRVKWSGGQRRYCPKCNPQPMTGPWRAAA